MLKKKKNPEHPMKAIYIKARMEEVMCLPRSLFIGSHLSLLPEFLHERHLVSVFDPVAKTQR